MIRNAAYEGKRSNAPLRQSLQTCQYPAIKDGHISPQKQKQQVKLCKQGT